MSFTTRALDDWALSAFRRVLDAATEAELDGLDAAPNAREARLRRGALHPNATIRGPVRRVKPEKSRE